MMLSCSAALNPFMTLIPPNVSVSLPVTSAFILPRALKIGRIILNALRQQDGFIALHDKSSPDEIKYQLNMSKKAFKNAVGGLFKQKLISIEDDGIRFLH